MWKTFFGNSGLQRFEQLVTARQDRNTEAAKPRPGRDTINQHLGVSTLLPFPHLKSLHGFMLQYIWEGDCNVFVAFCSFPWKHPFSLTVQSSVLLAPSLNCFTESGVVFSSCFQTGSTLTINPFVFRDACYCLACAGSAHKLFNFFSHFGCTFMGSFSHLNLISFLISFFSLYFSH